MHIKKGEQSMKILRINNSKGEFSTDGTVYKSVDDLTKEDIFLMIELVINSENIEFDDITPTQKVENTAQNIVYTSTLAKFKDLKNRRLSIIEEIKSEFSEAFKKYNK